MRLKELDKLLNETENRTEIIRKQLLRGNNKTIETKGINVEKIKLEYERKTLEEMKENIRNYMNRLDYLKKVREYENNSWGS